MPTPARHLSRFALAGVAATALLTSLPALALGRLADIQVIDRDSGETLTVHRHRGEHWVAGRPGARYAVSVRNATGARIMTVVSVDGVNVVTGETAAWHQNGYVLSPWQPYDITGWRKSDAEVAAFHFTSLGDSYAARTGRPEHLGVIGVAVFREKAATVLPQPLPQPYGRQHPQHHEAGRLSKSEAPPPAPASAAPASAAEAAADSVGSSRESAVASRRIAPQSAAPRLGTGHGERESAWVGQTTFERRSQRPDETISIRYDSRENLIAMGIIGTTPVPLRPNPFPAAALPRYVPDPS